MPYTINLSDGAFLVTVQDGNSDTAATSLTLPARGASNYGTAVAENFVYLVENFSAVSPPAHALIGQLWFDKNHDMMRAFNGSTWDYVGPYGFGVTPDIGAGATLGGNNNSSGNRIAGTSGVPLTLSTGYSPSPLALGATQPTSVPTLTTVTVMTSEGKVIAVASDENIANANLPVSIVIDNETFDFKDRFPNGISAGMTLATDAANYIYSGSNQFTNILVQVPYLLSGNDSGTANNIIITVAASIQSYGEFLGVETKIAQTNTGATLININGIGQRSVTRRDGTSLQPGDIIGGRLYHFVFDGLNFQVMDAQANGYVGPTGPAGVAGSQGPTGPTGPMGVPVPNSVLHFGNDTSGTANTIVATVTPSLSAYSADYTFLIKVANTVTGATLANINGLGPRSITRIDGSQLQPNDIVSGQMALLADNGTALQLVTSVRTVTQTSSGVGLYFGQDSSTTANQIVISTGANLQALQKGQLFQVLLANAVTGNTTIAIDGLPAVAVINGYGEQLATGDYLSYTIMLLSYDGASMRALNVENHYSASNIAIYTLPTVQSVYQATTTTAYVTGSPAPFGSIAGGVFTFTQAGLYIIIGSIQFILGANSNSVATGTDTCRFDTTIFHNGNIVSYMNAGFSLYYYELETTSLTCVIYASVGDTVSMSGFNQADNFNEQYNQFGASGTSLTITKVCS